MKRKIITSLMVLIMVIAVFPLFGDETHAAESRFYKTGDIGGFSATVSQSAPKRIGITGTALFGNAQLIEGTLKVNGQVVSYEEATVNGNLYYNMDIDGSAAELQITWQAKILSDNAVHLNSTGGTFGYRLLDSIGGGNQGNILSDSNFAERYNANGGSGTAPVVTIRKEGDAFQTKENMFTAPENNSFKEWNTKADGSGITYTENATFTMSADDVTFYAIWQPVNSSESTTSTTSPTVVTPTSSETVSETTSTDPAGYTDGDGTDDNDGPQTGDPGSSTLPLILLGVSAIVIGVSLWRKKVK